MNFITLSDLEAVFLFHSLSFKIQIKKKQDKQLSCCFLSCSLYLIILMGIIKAEILSFITYLIGFSLPLFQVQLVKTFHKCSEICLNCIHIQKQTVFFSFLFCQAYDSLLHVCVCAYLSLSVVCFCGFFTVFTMWLCVFVRPFQCKTHSVICSEMCVINKWPWLQNMAIFRCFQEKADTGNIIHTASEALRGMSEENNDVDVSFVISLLCLPDYTV